MALFFNGQCRWANPFLAKLLGVKFSLTVTWKTWTIKFNGRGWSPHGHVILHFLPLIDHNSLLVYYRFEYKGNFYKYGLYYTWVQMLLQIRPLLRFGPNVITDGTFITLGSSYYTCAFYNLSTTDTLRSEDTGWMDFLSVGTKKRGPLIGWREVAEARLYIC